MSNRKKFKGKGSREANGLLCGGSGGSRCSSRISKYPATAQWNLTPDQVQKQKHSHIEPMGMESLEECSSSDDEEEPPVRGNVEGIRLVDLENLQDFLRSSASCKMCSCKDSLTAFLDSLEHDKHYTQQELRVLAKERQCQQPQSHLQIVGETRELFSSKIHMECSCGHRVKLNTSKDFTNPGTKRKLKVERATQEGSVQRAACSVPYVICDTCIHANIYIYYIHMCGEAGPALTVTVGFWVHIFHST
jgi:hypothetical protein